MRLLLKVPFLLHYFDEKQQQIIWNYAIIYIY